MTYRQQILDLLAEHGPMTMRELADDIGIGADLLRCYVGSLRQRRPGVIYIHSYRRDEDGGRLYPRALWALGNKPDATRPPKLTHTEYNKRARAKARARVASVFHLAYVNRRNSVKMGVLA